MKINVFDHLERLGQNATDRVTGLSGVVVSISFDLYGCVSALIHTTLAWQGFQLFRVPGTELVNPEQPWPGRFCFAR